MQASDTNWKVELLDVFDRSRHVIGAFATRDEAVALAKAELAKRQPPPGMSDPTGGPHPPGIQDRIYVIPPEGAGAAWQYVGEEPA